MTSTLTTLDERAGVELDDTSSVSVLEQAGLNFQVETIHAHTPEGEQTDNRLLRRTDTNQVLGPIGSKYHVVQNHDAFAPFYDQVKQSGATFETAGVLRDGATCWVTARLPEGFDVRGDKYTQRMVMLMHHAAYRSNSYFMFNSRVVCNNMLSSLERAGRAGFRIRHDARANERLSNVGDVLSQATREVQTFKRVADKLQSRRMTTDQAAGYSTAFVRHFKRPDKQNSVLTTRESNRIEQLVDLFHNGTGNTGETRYDMMNAVTEYLDHHATGVTRKNHNAARAFMSNINGLTGTRKHQAVGRLMSAPADTVASGKWYLNN